MILHEMNQTITCDKLLEAARKNGIESKIVKIIIEIHGSVLFLKRSAQRHFPTLYELPGGKLNEYENVFSGAKRELLEETGLLIQKFVYMYKPLDFINVFSKKRCRQYTFIATIKEKDIILNPKEHSEYKWVSLSKIDSLYILPKTYKIIKKLLISPPDM